MRYNIITRLQLLCATFCFVTDPNDVSFVGCFVADKTQLHSGRRRVFALPWWPYGSKETQTIDSCKDECFVNGYLFAGLVIILIIVHCFMSMACIV